MSLDLPEGRVDYWDGHRWQIVNPAPLVAQAESLLCLPESEFRQALKAFNASVDRCVLYPADDDFGAVVLEALADACTDAGRKQRLYAAAARRAGGHASGASSGGEGIARSMHWKRIIRKLARKYEPMRDGGKSAQEVGACAAADGLDRGDVVTVLREVFDLTADEAIKVAHEGG